MALAYQNPMPVVDDVDMLLGAAALDLLAANATLLDGLSYREIAAFDSAIEDLGTVNTGSGATKGDRRAWWGSFLYQTGMTTLTIVGNLLKQGSETLQVFVNGSTTASATISASGPFSVDIDISSGFTDGQIVPVEVRKVGATIGYGSYVVTDVYAWPLTMPAAWPGVPTFTVVDGRITLSAAQLNQLGSAEAWLLQRLNLVPLLPMLCHAWAYGTHRAPVKNVWTGTVLTAGSNTIARLNLTYQNQVCPAAYVDVELDGTVIQRYGPYAAGDTAVIYAPFVIAGAGRHLIRLNDRVTVDAPPTDNRNNLWTIDWVRSERDASGYPYAAALPTFTTHESLSPSTVAARLNAISTVLANVYARISSDADSFGRARALRKRYAIDDHQLTKNAAWYNHRFDRRRGDRLVVRGRNVQLAWGARTLDTQDGQVDTMKYHYTHTETLIDGDTLETTTIFLDTIAGLFVGTPYVLTGEVDYAEERLL